MMKDGDVEGFWALIEKGFKPLSFAQHVPYTAPYFLGSPLAAPMLRQMVSLAKSHITARIDRGPLRKDFMDHILELEGAEKMTLDNICADATLAMTAGSDTTATTTSNACFYLVTHPELLARLRNEIDEAFPLSEGRDPTDTAKLGAMPFLNAVLHECLRLYPPVPIGIQRSPERGRGSRLIGDRFMPEGTALTVSPYAIHRDARYFSPHPDSFIPDRWLYKEGGQDAPSDFVNNVDAFVPFSLGHMSCPGKGLAFVEMRIVLSMLVQKFDMRVKNGWNIKEWENGFGAYLILTRGKLPIELSLRQT